MCLNKQEYALGPKYAKILSIASSEYGNVLNMQTLHSVLNMPEWLDRVLNYLRF